MQKQIQSASSTKKIQPTSAVLIANPTSGSYVDNKKQVDETVQFLQAQGWDAHLQLTQRQGDAGRIAREAVERNIDVVVAIGGDGTINEVIQELAGSETALGILPSGTVNVWAREVGIPLENEAARDILLQGQRRRIDLSKVDDRYFLLMAGIGLDAEVTHEVEQKPAKKLGVPGYLLVGLWKTLTFKGFRVYLHIDGKKSIKAHAMQIVIGNTQLYGGAIKYTWQAKCNDGLLDVCIARSQDLINTLLMGIDVLLHRRQRRQWVLYETCKEVEIRTRHAITIQVDGDPSGFTSERGVINVSKELC
ncbi:diacylglycerol/lipid kinase family protein [Ktedonobacter racemifer]|uniref:Diacylglycerol kinase catalytic region n=1 Tax=Ktedonobacter racemifer DSM 44963 TaxID=485913 RepID=D6TMQ8_KTERA|nr:diacylglycerol kinase family protein [Ktedonobacter racemifer]EFH87058.1 diacylglycerol kinase catalytic region [Ktedonobacter racemifer DSM 44963]